MWAALTSDLKDFVSGVEEETTVVSTKLSETVQSLERGDDTALGEDGIAIQSGFDATGMVVSAADEVSRRSTLVETYTEPLDETDPDVVAFMSSFDLESKTEQIATLLATSVSIKECFEQVCPEQVAYKDFWMRYFYHCDEERIQLQWDHEQQAKKMARDAVISSGIAKVTSLFGGAVAAVSKAVERNDKAAHDPVPASPFQFNAGASLFGGARPPFVLNTAVDEDEDDNEEEEAEEELGWGDDDDSFDEDEQEGNDDEDDQKETEEEIEFTQDLSDDKLIQALAERDALQQTVELQAKELAALKDGKESPATIMQIEGLTMKMFEKDAELAAFKASGEDNQMDNKQAKMDHANIKALEAKIEEMKDAMDLQAAEMVKAKEDFKLQLVALANEAEIKMKAVASNSSQEDGSSQLTASVETANITKDELDSLKHQLSDALGQVALANETCATLENALNHARAEIDAQRETYEVRLKEETVKLEAVAEKSTAKLVKEIDSLTLQLQATKTKAEAADEKVALLAAEIAAIKAKETNDAKVADEESNTTTSTGVKVPIPDNMESPVSFVVASTEENAVSSPTVAVSAPPTLHQDGEPEEDWGDDW